MTKLRNFLLTTTCFAMASTAFAQQVDFSVVSAPEESGNQFIRITSDADCVCLPVVRRPGDNIDWLSNHILDIAYLFHQHFYKRPQPPKALL